MTVRSLFSLSVAAVLLLAIATCSDDDNPTGGTPDTTPPGVSSVTPVDAFHIDVTFSERVTKSSAEDDDNYSITESTPAPLSSRADLIAPGDPMQIVGLTLKGDGRTVTVTTGGSMAGLNYDLTVDGVSDTQGNTIGDPIGRTFTGSSAPDENAPQIVSRSPADGATNVPIGTSVTFQFSEAVTYASVSAGASWTSQTGPVPFTLQQDGTTFALIPAALLANNALQTITLQGVQDFAGNTMTDTEWSFTTTSMADNTPPTLVSTTPTNNATNVDVNTNLSLTFSEAVNQLEFNVVATPDPGDGEATWSNGGKTVTFDPLDPLFDDQQYVLTIYPGGVLDLAGNGIEGLHQVVFTTGSALETGRIAGTMAGDAGTAAADPTGATVIATSGIPFEGEFDIAGSAIVAGNNTYNVQHLADDVYYLISVLDTNDDGNLDPGDGDAIGAYGVNFFTMDFEPDSVEVVGGAAVTGINFALFDPSAITGSISYSGAYAEGFWTVYVGLFTTTDFNAEPFAGANAYWPEYPLWGFNSLDQTLPDDTYYVAAFIDVNSNASYDPATDPAGAYGGIMSPTPLNVANGSDHTGIVIPLVDPLIASATASVTWPTSKQNAKFQRLCDAVRAAEMLKQGFDPHGSGPVRLNPVPQPIAPPDVK
jgi:methionine-rich copper-binding protein CopC